jgi:hypothetical protein
VLDAAIAAAPSTPVVRPATFVHPEASGRLTTLCVVVAYQTIAQTQFAEFVGVANDALIVPPAATVPELIADWTIPMATAYVVPRRMRFV